MLVEETKYKDNKYKKRHRKQTKTRAEQHTKLNM